MAEQDYGEIRRRNIEARKAKFAELFNEIETERSSFEFRKASATTRRRTLNTRRSSSDEDNENQPPKRRRQSTKNYRPEFSRTYNTRSRTRKINENDNSENNDNKSDNGADDNELAERYVSKGRPLKVIFPWAKTFQREMEITRIDKWDVDKELAEENYYSEEHSMLKNGTRRKTRQSEAQRISKSVYDPSTIPSPDEITDEMLDNVLDKASAKNYSKINGTSCHQCRQKTMDTKTVCRSGECIGVRGQFCGPCLRGRYGEDARTVLKDPNWACPPCRGLCNCSICRTRNGQRPTGILAPVAQEEGFSSVMDYLQATIEEDDGTLEHSN